MRGVKQRSSIVAVLYDGSGTTSTASLASPKFGRSMHILPNANYVPRTSSSSAYFSLLCEMREMSVVRAQPFAVGCAKCLAWILMHRSALRRGAGDPMFLKRVQCLFIPMALSLPALAVSAQGYPFSQRGSVSQTVAFTTITITYGRPVARGRALFGALVPWDSIWHPGADSATRIVFDHDALVEGQTVRAGAYSVWLIPREHSPWTLILNRKARAFHKPYPGSETEALRVEVTPEEVSQVESLAIYFPMVLRDEALMRIHWGTTSISIRIKAPFRPGHAKGVGD